MPADKRVLLLGGTGAMGVYLTEELVDLGFSVDITTRSKKASDNRKIKYIQGNAHDLEFIKKLLGKDHKYTAIVDFMVYTTEEFKERYLIFLNNTEQYIFTSSYRVFADSGKTPITEQSPRLLDTVKDEEYLQTDEYALAKARQEDLITNSKSSNWTIIRPAITYSKERFQLGVLEADTVVFRAMQKAPAVLPEPMLYKLATMTWAGDVAKMIARLVSNKEALCQSFNVATSESHTWAEVAQYYKTSIGLNAEIISLQEYLDIVDNKYQVQYDRMFNRVLDNTKILKATNMSQKDLTELETGLDKELSAFIKKPQYPRIDYALNAKLDKLTKSQISLDQANDDEKNTYLSINPPMSQKIKNLLHPRTRIRSTHARIKSAMRVRTRIKTLRSLIKARYYYDGAILTLTGAYNYGGMIQRYALKEFLRQHGYRYEFIIPFPSPYSEDQPRFADTSRFVSQYLDQIEFNKRTAGQHRTIIVGSDQVWRDWNGDWDYVGRFFLDFPTRKDTKKLTYAASFGKNVFDSPNADKATPLVKQFDAISMREQSGVKIVKKLWDIEAVHVVDPTLLLTSADYNNLIQSYPRSNKPVSPIFYYILDETPDIDKFANKVTAARKQDMTRNIPEKGDHLPAVEYWLQCFRDSEFVITDSFHGIVFSIINKTQFVVIGNHKRGLTRMQSLLKDLGLEDRLILDSDLQKIKPAQIKEIDWDKVYQKLEKRREFSSNWLVEQLKRQPNN